MHALDETGVWTWVGRAGVKKCHLNACCWWEVALEHFNPEPVNDLNICRSASLLPLLRFDANRLIRSRTHRWIEKAINFVILSVQTSLLSLTRPSRESTPPYIPAYIYGQWFDASPTQPPMKRCSTPTSGGRHQPAIDDIWRDTVVLAVRIIVPWCLN